MEGKRTFWLAVLGAGVLAGALAVAFHAGLDFALAERERLTAWAQRFGPAGAPLLLAVCAAAVGLAVWMTGRLAPLAAGSGIQHVEGVVRGLFPIWPLSVVAVKFVGGIVGIGGGLVLGREGPTVQMGASFAHRLAHRLGLSEADQRILLAVGAGAGLTGAFNAPLAGTLFVVEELKCPFQPAIYLGSLLASAVTDAVVRFSLGPVADLELAGRVMTPPLSVLLPVTLLGIVGGALGVVFNASLMATFTIIDRWKRHVPLWVLGLGLGALLGGVAWFAPALPGGGVTYATRVLNGDIAPAATCWLLPLSFVLTLASYTIGAPGGIFAPLLVIGAVLGLAFHGGWQVAFPSSAGSMPVFAAAGMASLFAGVVRSPFTGAVLLVEMTGAYALVLPLVAASLVAHAVAEATGSKPVYESLLDRELARRAADVAPRD
jgi:CIC family chloride channel protein